MDVLLRPLFSVLSVPELKLKRPGWVQQPSPYTVFALVLLSYFLVTGERSACQTGMNKWLKLAKLERERRE